MFFDGILLFLLHLVLITCFPWRLCAVTKPDCHDYQCSSVAARKL